MPAIPDFTQPGWNKALEGRWLRANHQLTFASPSDWGYKNALRDMNDVMATVKAGAMGAQVEKPTPQPQPKPQPKPQPNMGIQGPDGPVEFRDMTAVRQAEQRLAEHQKLRPPSHLPDGKQNPAFNDWANRLNAIGKYLHALRESDPKPFVQSDMRNLELLIYQPQIVPLERRASVSADDNTSIWDQPLDVRKMFLQTHGPIFEHQWKNEQNRNLALRSATATSDGQSLATQSQGVKEAYIAAHGPNAPAAWARDHAAKNDGVTVAAVSAPPQGQGAQGQGAQGQGAQGQGAQGQGAQGQGQQGQGQQGQGPQGANTEMQVFLQNLTKQLQDSTEALAQERANRFAAEHGLDVKKFGLEEQRFGLEQDRFGLSQAQTEADLINTLSSQRATFASPYMLRGNQEGVPLTPVMGRLLARRNIPLSGTIPGQQWIRPDDLNAESMRQAWNQASVQDINAINQDPVARENMFAAAQLSGLDPKGFYASRMSGMPNEGRYSRTLFNQ